MLKFFRKIRQNLIGTGDAKRYLLYAIGEILLVVIGILIALQINNWNQNRLNQIKELDYLQQLQSDLQADTTMYADFLVAVDYKKKFLKSILNGDLERFQPVSRIGVYDLFVSRFKSAPIPRDNAYQEMTSSGSLNLIQNQNLKEQILNYYRRIRNRTAALENKYSDWQKVISELIPGNNEDFDRIAAPFQFPEKAEKALIRKLLNQKEKLSPHINAEIQYAFLQAVSFTQLNQRAVELLDALNQEIAKRKN